MNQKRVIKRHLKKQLKKKNRLVKNKLRDRTCDNCAYCFVYRSYRGENHGRCKHPIKKDGSLPKENTCLLWKQGQEENGYQWWSHYIKDA